MQYTSLPFINKMADLLIVRCTNAFLVKELLLAAAEAAIVIVFTLVFLMQAFEAYVTVLAAFKLWSLLRAELIATTIGSILDLAALFSGGKAARTFTSIAEA